MDFLWVWCVNMGLYAFLTAFLNFLRYVRLICTLHSSINGRVHSTFVFFFMGTRANGAFSAFSAAHCGPAFFIFMNYTEPSPFADRSAAGHDLERSKMDQHSTFAGQPPLLTRSSYWVFTRLHAPFLPQHCRSTAVIRTGFATAQADAGWRTKTRAARGTCTPRRRLFGLFA